MEMIKGLKFKNKIGAAFGSYGWSGESVKLIENGLIDAGFRVQKNGIKVLWTPNDEDLYRSSDFGSRIISDMIE